MGWRGTTNSIRRSRNLQAYAVAECTAMKGRAGLWSDAHPVQPQDFRHATNSPLLFDTNGCRRSSGPTSGPVRGNSRSRIFHWPACPNYSDIRRITECRSRILKPQRPPAIGLRTIVLDGGGSPRSMAFDFSAVTCVADSITIDFVNLAG